MSGIRAILSTSVNLIPFMRILKTVQAYCFNQMSYFSVYRWEYSRKKQNQKIWHIEMHQSNGWLEMVMRCSGLNWHCFPFRNYLSLSSLLFTLPCLIKNADVCFFEQHSYCFIHFKDACFGGVVGSQQSFLVNEHFKCVSALEIHIYLKCNGQCFWQETFVLILHPAQERCHF